MVESKPNLTGLDGRVGSAYEVLPELFTKTKSSMFSLFDSSFIEYIEIPNYNNSLTHLAFGGDIEDERIMQLVQSNAQSLQILEMMHIMNGNIAELLQSEEGDDQIFPQLRKLHLRKTPMGQVLRRVETTEAVVFPSLKWLSIDMPYPLADDTFLRGNAGTLEYLEMQIDTESIDMLRNFNVFQKNRFANLKHLKLRSAITGDDENNNMVLGNISLQMFLQGISETPRRLCIDGFSVFEELMESISRLPSMNNLRVLNIMDTRVSLSQIPEMLSRLPFLEELAIGYTADFGPMFRQVPLDDLPQYISSRFSSMSPHLWKLNQSFDEDDISLETFASYAVMMKIMCPSLTRVMAPDTIQKEYREIIQTEITKPYLQTHKKDLLVLLRAMPKILVRLI
ncbi:hypothetical protein GGF39_002283 [Coemansia sp. RSA 1721]|nr:hypothetical protein GGF39_002283 [Coemansia sp. RSA 1721]